MWDEARDDSAVGTEQQDGVECDEEGGEDTGDDRLFSDANVGAKTGEEEEEGRNDGGGEGRAAVVLFLKNAGEDEGEGCDADAGKLVDRQRRITGSLN